MPHLARSRNCKPYAADDDDVDDDNNDGDAWTQTVQRVVQLCDIAV